MGGQGSGRARGSFEYSDTHKEKVFDLISFEPKTTQSITHLAQERYWARVHQATILRLLRELQLEGKIKCNVFGVKKKIYAWKR
jgi:DNA-binding PadR family transcriptional regulator